MDENRILFKVSKGEEDTVVSFHTESLDDVFSVAMGISSAFDTCSQLEEIVEVIRIMKEKDQNVSDLIDSATIHMPDFDKILKEK